MHSVPDSVYLYIPEFLYTAFRFIVQKAIPKLSMRENYQILCTVIESSPWSSVTASHHKESVSVSIVSPLYASV